VMMKETISSGSSADFVIKYPLMIPEKTDLEVRASSSGSNNLISANFSIIYIKNDTLVA